jgi:hypothetical protein
VIDVTASSVVGASLPLLIVIGIPLWAVVLTAIWARSPERRKDARRVLHIIARRTAVGQTEPTTSDAEDPPVR